MQQSDIMSDKEFNTFITTNSGRKGGATINFTTNNISKKAQHILADTQFKALAKQHISASIKDAYYNMPSIKAKFEDIASKHNITIIA